MFFVLTLNVNIFKVIPMLPKILSENLCSLNPNEERLTFSVVWKMDDEAEVKDTWFGRSIIHSCSQMAYEHAQVIYFLLVNLFF